MVSMKIGVSKTVRVMKMAVSIRRIIMVNLLPLIIRWIQKPGFEEWVDFQFKFCCRVVDLCSMPPLSNSHCLNQKVMFLDSTGNLIL